MLKWKYLINKGILMIINKLTVNFEDKPCYDIVISKGFTDLINELKKLNIDSNRICIITDTNVASIYLDSVKEELEGLRIFTHIFEAGEKNKNLDIVSGIYETLIINKFDRKDVLLALGGGVVGDICGFVAATYLRGIDFIQIPTTLLSQVDSSIGGKTGVDFKQYKNMVGAFCMPKLVYVNINTLNTLSTKDFTSGMGEVINHGIIFDSDYYYWINKNSEKILLRDVDILADMVLTSQKIKKAVVEADPYEQGQRAILNFGHTLGHAIEREKNFTLTHGVCVGLGMLAAFDICIKKGKLGNEDRDFFVKLLKKFSFDIETEIDKEAVYKATFNDKKMEGGKIKFVLLNSIGEAYIDREVSKADMMEALEYICKKV